MTTIYFVRHGENALVGDAIAGRTPGVHLNAAGRKQAEQLAEHLGQLPFQALFSSPLERARETAEPLARRLGLELQISQSLIEIDFGEWNGQKISELDKLESWKQWNSFRSAGRPPGGESMLEVQARLVGEIERLRRRYPDGCIGLFSHGDPIRAALVYYLGLPLDLLLRLEVSTASASNFQVNDWSVRFGAINQTFH